MFESLDWIGLNFYHWIGVLVSSVFFFAPGHLSRRKECELLFSSSLLSQSRFTAVFIDHLQVGEKLLHFEEKLALSLTPDATRELLTAVVPAPAVKIKSSICTATRFIPAAISIRTQMCMFG